MKLKDYITAIIGIIAFLAIGIVILIYYRVSDVFYFMLGIIIIGIFVWLYTALRKRQSKKSITWLKNSKEKAANEIKEIYLNTEKNLNEILGLNEISIDQEERELKYIKMNLASLGCYTQSYELIPTTLGKLNLSYLAQKKKEINEAIKKIENSVTEKLNYKISELYSNLRIITTDAKNAGFNINELNIDTKINNIREGIEKINFLRNKEREIFDALHLEILNLENLASKIQDTSEIKNNISLIERNFDGMKKTIEIRKKLNEILEKKVDEVKESIYKGQRKLSSITLMEDEKEEFENIVQGIENLNIKNIGNIETIENEYRNFLKRLLQRLQEKFSDNIRNYSVEIPEWLKRKYGKENESAIENSINISIEESLNIKEWTDKVIEKIIYMEKQCENVNIAERIMRSCKVVFEIIDRVIANKGYVTPDDLSVNYKEDFLYLYMEKHPEEADKVKIINNELTEKQLTEEPLTKQKGKEKETKKRKEMKIKETKGIKTKIKRKRGRPKKRNTLKK